ncbi:MAG: MBL fold metallo-hydrolase [Flavobacteriaceae bacterium]|nr:MBL fold metallo-hydrolase [Flavobacteriaceae bacterium]
MIRLQSFGAAQCVTGSKHLLTTATGKRILLDCGLFQGQDAKKHDHNRRLGFDPASIDYCILSHAHIDHSGALPYLVKQGYKGPIYSTQATYDLCSIMLLDSAHIQESDIKYINRKRLSKGKKALKPLYSIADAEACLKQFVCIDFNANYTIDNTIQLMFTVVGHILGAAAVNLLIKEDDAFKSICYTGDIGRKKHDIIKAPEAFNPAEYIIAESTYGDRLHPKEEDVSDKLLQIVLDTCIVNKGKLIIPAFSVGRTQEIVYTLDRLSFQGKLPPIPVFVDSPLSTNATNIIRKHPSAYNQEVKEYLKKDSDPFCFNRLKYVRSAAESKAINKLREPAIIITASGMMEAGRVLHHLRNNISDARNTVLIVGYCAPKTLGRRLMDGAKQVKIFGEEFSVNARIEVIEAYSAHGDAHEMLAYLSQHSPQQVKRLFLVHGEYPVQQAFSNLLKAHGFKDIVIPEEAETNGLI